MKEKMIKLWQSSNIWMAVGSVLLLMSMVVPLVYIAQYIWPSSDDFEMSLWCKQMLDAGGSVWQVIGRAVDYAVYKWKVWQGAFASIFVMALQPGLWGDQYYSVGVAAMIVGLVAAAFLLTYVLMVKQAKAPKSVWLILTALPMWAWFFRVMYTEEAFYWYTGASYYTGFHSWVMLMLALSAYLYMNWDKCGKVKKKLLYLLCFVCFFLGGGNYPSALLQVLVLAGYFMAAVCTRKRSRTILGAYTLSALGGLLLSALAPGNVNHMNNDFQADISAVEAIFIAIRDGLKDIRIWTNPSVIMLFVFLLPFVWTLARSCPCSFRFPLLATVLSGGLFLAEYSPCSYTFGGFPPGRMINLFYWNYYWLLLFNMFYWAGWLDRKAGKKWRSKIDKAAAGQKRWQPLYILLAGIVWLLAVKNCGIENSNFYWLYKEMKNGVYQHVDQFMEERIAYFNEHKGEAVEIEGIPYKSEITFFEDIYPQSNHLVNFNMAEYYGLESITMK